MARCQIFIAQTALVRHLLSEIRISYVLLVCYEKLRLYHVALYTIMYTSGKRFNDAKTTWEFHNFNQLFASFIQQQ